MHLILWFSTAFFVGVLVFMAVGAWRISTGHAQVRPLKERLAIATIFGLIGWQAATWIPAGHAGADQARVVAVWVQLVGSWGITALSLMQGWLAPRATRSAR